MRTNSVAYFFVPKWLNELKWKRKDIGSEVIESGGKCEAPFSLTTGIQVIDVCQVQNGSRKTVTNMGFQLWVAIQGNGKKMEGSSWPRQIVGINNNNCLVNLPQFIIPFSKMYYSIIIQGKPTNEFINPGVSISIQQSIHYKHDSTIIISFTYRTVGVTSNFYFHISINPILSLIPKANQSCLIKDTHFIHIITMINQMQYTSFLISNSAPSYDCIHSCIWFIQVP